MLRFVVSMQLLYLYAKILKKRSIDLLYPDTAFPFEVLLNQTVKVSYGR